MNVGASLASLPNWPDLPERARNLLNELLKYHEDETVARDTAQSQDYLASAEGHIEAYRALERLAEHRGIHITDLAAMPK